MAGKKDHPGQFKPGNSLGKLKSQPEMRMARTATKTEFVMMAEGIAVKSEEEMKAQCERPEKTMLESMVWDAHINKDRKFLSWVVEMAIGKPSTLTEPEEKISNIEALLKALANNRDPFAPRTRPKKEKAEEK